MASTHYDAQYFQWQKQIGDFGGWANLPKFTPHIKPTDEVLDFGCGGGYLLKNIDCKRKLGVEINAHARSVARDNGVEVFASLNEVPASSVDVVISNHCL